jgi:hypothetical protein
MSSKAIGLWRRGADQCKGDPQCVGFSATHLFYSDTVMARGTPVYTVRDERGDVSYVKDLYPTVFL